MCPNLIVVNSTEKNNDGDGRSVEFLVEVDSSDQESPQGIAAHSLTQIELDDFITVTKGILADHTLASRFKDCQAVSANERFSKLPSARASKFGT
jgi:hypothetical protein